MSAKDYAYAKYIQKAKRADEIYETIRDLYGWETPWKQAYFMAIKDRMMSQEEKNLVKEFHPVK